MKEERVSYEAGRRRKSDKLGASLVELKFKHTGPRLHL